MSAASTISLIPQLASALEELNQHRTRQSLLYIARFIVLSAIALIVTATAGLCSDDEQSKYLAEHPSLLAQEKTAQAIGSKVESHRARNAKSSVRRPTWALSGPAFVSDQSGCDLDNLAGNVASLWNSRSPFLPRNEVYLVPGDELALLGVSRFREKCHCLRS